MSSYKIAFQTQEEGKQIQDLLFQLGYEWKYRNIGKNFHETHDNVCYLYARGDCITTGFASPDGRDHFEKRSNECVKITIPELQDLVVLARSSVDDANYFHNETGIKYFVSSMNEYYFWTDGWIASNNVWSTEKLTMIVKPKNQGFISGEEALSDFNNSQVSEEGSSKWTDLDCCKYSIPQILEEKDKYSSGHFKLLFRRKPEIKKLIVNLAQPKRIETDPVTGAAGLIYEDNKVAREVAEDLKQQFGLV